MNDQVIKVNLIPDMGTPAVAKVSQYDVGRPLQFVILDGATRATLAAGTKVYIKGTKPSGLGFSVYKTLGVGGSTITFQTRLDITQECGRIPCELRVVDGDNDIGTANFILDVEKTPHADGTTDGTQETMQNLETRLQTEIDGLDDRIEALEEAEESGLTEAVKSALLQIAQKVAYIDEHGQTYYDALYNALYPPADLVSITATYTQSGTVYTTASLDSLKSDLTVSAEWSDGSSSIIADTDYTLSGTLTEGTSTVTVNYGGQSTIFNVTVTAPPTLQSITATYTQSGTVYDTASLDDLKSDLVVTANYSDSTSETVTEYTLTGALAVGTSTITVTYGGKTASFNVAVTHEPNYTRDGLQGYWDFTNVEDDYFGELTNIVSDGDLRADAIYAHNAGNNAPLSGVGVNNGEFISTTSKISGVYQNHCPTAIRVSTVANHPVFYTAYPYSVEWYGKFVGSGFNGTGYDTPFAYATGSATEPMLINTRNTANPESSAFNSGGQGTLIVVQDGVYKSFGAVGQGNNTIEHSGMTPESYHHYVITVAKTSIKIYVDGVLIGEGTATNNNSASASYGLLLGMYTSIKFVRVYNKILSAEEVATNYSDI